MTKQIPKVILLILSISAVVIIGLGTALKFYRQWQTQSIKQPQVSPPQLIADKDSDSQLLKQVFDQISADKPNIAVEQLQESASQWKIYRNDEFGFEIKYPADWNMSKQSRHPKMRQTIVEFSVPAEYPAILEIYYGELFDKNRDLYSLLLDYPYNKNPKAIFIGKEPGIQTSPGGILCEQANDCILFFSFWNEELYKRRLGFEFEINVEELVRYLIDNNNAEYRKFRETPEPYFEEDVKLIRQVLSTFRFTN